MMVVAAINPADKYFECEHTVFDFPSWSSSFCCLIHLLLVLFYFIFSISNIFSGKVSVRNPIIRKEEKSNRVGAKCAVRIGVSTWYDCLSKTELDLKLRSFSFCVNANQMQNGERKWTNK